MPPDTNTRPEREQCPMCGGSGNPADADPQMVWPCPRCGGSGEVGTGYFDESTPGRNEITKPCPDCDPDPDEECWWISRWWPRGSGPQVASCSVEGPITGLVGSVSKRIRVVRASRLRAELDRRADLVRWLDEQIEERTWADSMPMDRAAINALRSVRAYLTESEAPDA